jgi:hypothetical protein
MPKLKPGTIIPNSDETAVINSGIEADADARELGSDWHKGAKPASEALAPQAYAALVAARVKVLVAYFMRPMAAYPVQLNVR